MYRSFIAKELLAHLLTHPEPVYKPHVAMLRIGVLGWKEHHREMGATFKEWFGGRDFKELSERERRRWRTYSEKKEFKHIGGMADSIVMVGQATAREETRTDRLARWIGRLSPYGCLQNAAVSLAGTGMQRRQALRESLEEYARKTVDFVQSFSGSGRRHEEFIADNAPRYSFAPFRVGEALEASMIDIGLLLLMGVLFMLIGYARFVRMEIQ
jgi:hypothetical protein